MTTQNIADVSFTISWKTGDMVSKIAVMSTDMVTDKMRSEASKNKRTLASMEQLKTLTRIRRENIALFLNALAKGEEEMSDDDLNERLRESLQEWINMPENGATTEASKAMNTTTTTSETPATGATQASDKKAAAEAAAAERKAQAEAAAAEKKAQAEAAAAQKKAEREAAAAQRKQEQEAKAAAAKEARDAAAAARQKEIDDRKAEREANAAKATEALEAAKAEHDAKVTDAETALAAATEALKSAKAARTDALKAIGEQYKIAVPGGSGTVTQVDKSTSFVLDDDYVGLDGVTIAKGERMTVKKIHLAGIAAGLENAKILEEIKKLFPNGGTTVKDVAWHRNMVKNGKIDAVTGKRID